MKDEITKRSIRRTVIALVLLVIVILVMFVYSVSMQGTGAS